MEGENNDGRRSQDKIARIRHTRTYNGSSKRTKFRKLALEKNKIRQQLQVVCTPVTNPPQYSTQSNTLSENEKCSTHDNSFDSSNNQFVDLSGGENFPCSSDNSVSSSFSDASNDSDNRDTNLSNLHKQLCLWSKKHNITNCALTDILHILKPHHPTLALDARTLLQTPSRCYSM